MWRQMDILDNYEASALSHPTDKKNAGKVRSALQGIERKINVKLYGAVSTDKGKKFWDMMHDPQKRQRLLDV